MLERGEGLSVLSTPDGFGVRLRQSSDYAITVGPGAFDRLAAILGDVMRKMDSPSVHCLTDTTVAGLHLGRLEDQLKCAGSVRVSVDVLPDGETAKTPQTLLRCWRTMAAEGVSRRTLVVGLGGGVVCDLTGLVAATFMRGLPYALVPTSLVAQADAAIGGKCGIDLDDAKNLVGSFYNPQAVVVDPVMLATLPALDIRAGLAEVIKVAMVGDADLLTRLMRSSVRELATDPVRATQIIKSAIAAKLRLLSADPLERGTLRRGLNLGHCVGHPIESAHSYRVRHGAAVAAGIAVAASLSLLFGLSSVAYFDAVLSALRRFDLPVRVDQELRSTVWSNLNVIRRVRNQSLELVVPVSPGEWTVLEDIDIEQFYEALELLDEASDHAL